MTSKKYIPLFVLGLMTASNLLAQNTNGEYNESVIVVGDYKPVLEEAFKINVAPSITDTNNVLQHTFNYDITPKRITSIFNPSHIRAARIVSESATGLYNNYLRVGMGNYWTPLLDAYYNSTRSKTLNYGARLYHNSSWGRIGHKPTPDLTPEDKGYYSLSQYYGQAPQSMTELSLFGKYIHKEYYQFSSDLTLQNDYGLYYGFNDSVLNSVVGRQLSRDSISKKNYSYMWNYVSWNLGAKNLQTDVNKFGYEANANLNNLHGRYGQNEMGIKLDGNVHYGFPLFKKSKGIAWLHMAMEHYTNRYINDSMEFPFYHNTIDLSVADFSIDSSVWKKTLLHINPYLDFIFNGFQVHGGVNIVNEHMDSVNHLVFFPDVMISKSFMKDALNFNAGLTGDMQQVTLNDIRLVNPYIQPGCYQLEAFRHTDLYGHVRFNFSKKLELNARAEISRLKNDLSFKPNTSEYPMGNVFTTKFDNLTRAKVGATFAVHNDEKLNVEVGANYYLYLNPQEASTPLLYRPKWDAHVVAEANVNDKVYVRLESLLVGKMYADFNEVKEITDTLPIKYGLGLEVEYRHSRALSFFVKTDNLAMQRYFMWANYPSKRLQILAGLTYTIPTKKH